jgi:hypothetical protein
VRWTYLTDGAVYDPDRWTFTMPAGTPPFTPADRAAASPVEDIFDSAAADHKGFRLTRAALDLAGAARSHVLLGVSYETDPVFTVALAKPGTFTAWANGAAAAAAAGFADLTVAMYTSARQP